MTLTNMNWRYYLGKTDHMTNVANEQTDGDTIIWYWACLSEANYSPPYLNQKDAQNASDRFLGDDGFCNYYDDHNAFHRVLSMRWSKYQERVEYANKVNKMVRTELSYIVKDGYDDL